MLSSHLVADLERVCDYLIVLVASRVRVAGEVSDLLASHHRLSGPRRDPGSLPAGQEVITESHTDKQSSLLVRTDGPVLDPAWTVKPVSLEDLVLAYMSRAGDDTPARRSHLESGVMIRLSLASVPRPGHHRGRGAGRVRGPARGHRAAPGQPVRRQRRSAAATAAAARSLASNFLSRSLPQAPTRCCTCSAS